MDINGCLIIHGFGGTVHEINYLANYLSNNGYIVACPRLSGHTGNGKDMKNADYKDWLTSAEEGLIKLMEKTKNIAIIGFSMGGLVSVNLGCKYDIKTIITINTPIYYWNIYRVVLNLIDDFKNGEFKNIKRYIRAKESCPMISMINFLKLLDTTKRKLPSINCPFLIMQTEDDDTTQIKSAYYIYDNIKSTEKKIYLYNKGGHLVLLSPYKEKIIMDVGDYLGYLCNDSESQT